MSPDLLWTWAWSSTVWSVASLAALRLTRTRPAHERSILAHYGLAAAVLTPAVVSVTPRWVVELPAAVAASPATMETTPIPAATVGVETLDVLASVYAAGVILILAVLVISLFNLQIIRWRARAVSDEAWTTALAVGRRRLGVRRDVRLLTTSVLKSPVSCGLFQPTILLDERSLNDIGTTETVIGHELAHLARFDFVKLTLSRAAVAVLWFNPLVWWLARSCHELTEEAADEAATHGSVDRMAYAAVLVAAARNRGGTTFLAANGMASGEHALRRRVDRLLARDPAPSTPWPSRSIFSLAASAVLLTSLAAVAVQAAPPKMEAVIETPRQDIGASRPDIEKLVVQSRPGRRVTAAAPQAVASGPAARPVARSPWEARIKAAEAEVADLERQAEAAGARAAAARAAANAVSRDAAASGHPADLGYAAGEQGRADADRGEFHALTGYAQAARAELDRLRRSRPPPA